MRLLRPTLALLLCSGFAHASTIIMQSLDAPLGMQQQLWIDENGTNTQLYWAGGINGSVDGHARVFWCVQLFVNIGLGQTYNTVVDFADTTNLKRVAWLVQNYATGVTTQIQGAAFQLAIWDIIEDNGDGFTSGKVAKSTDVNNPTDPNVLAQAVLYESYSVNKTYIYEDIYHNTTINGGTAVQNLVTYIYADGGPGGAPEPGDAALILGGLALMWVGRSRKILRKRPH